ncbi:hypothetical protein AB0L57_25660 [Nocardia sp. NPDC052254]|uniref:MmyB family transcriptional regulator n=1 Tax=Nocardia sp. NPDC052254 TaxID=3155681 RepID=UPI00342C986B
MRTTPARLTSRTASAPDNAAGPAAHREDHKTIEHPAVGPITVDCDVLTDGDAELEIVIMTAVPGSPDENTLRLAAINGPVRTSRPVPQRPAGQQRQPPARSADR